MPVAPRTPAILTAAIILAGGSFLYAQMGPNDARLIPYQGALYAAGDPANGPHDFRFALFSVEPSEVELDCLLAEPPSCALWAEEQTGVPVENGTFSVALGDVEAVTDTMLAQSALYVGVAVKSSADAGFQRLVGTSRILPAAWASRAAAANDFSVAGNVTATNIDASGAVTAGTAVQGRNVVSRPTNAGQNTVAFQGRTSDNAFEILLRTDGVQVTSNTDLFLTTASGRSIVANNHLRGTNGISTAGRLLSDCPTGMNRVRPNSAVCIDAAATSRGVYNWYDTARLCHDVGKRLCTMAEASVATRSGTTASYSISTFNIWAWVEGSGTASGPDFGACHVNLNFNEPGAIHGEANCQIAAAGLDPNLAVLCCYEQ